MSTLTFLLALQLVLQCTLGTMVLCINPFATFSATQSQNATVLGYVFDNFELLDLFGPLELFTFVPGLQIRLVSANGRPVRSRGGVVVKADYSFASAPANPDIFLIPGGDGTWLTANSTKHVNFVKKIAAGTKKTTLSVCTGAAMLARAGVLDGKRATTNKAAFKYVMESSKKTNWVYHARWVEDGNVVSSAGVSAGIDAAAQVIKRNWGDAAAQLSVRYAEYVWNTDSTKDDFSGLYPDPTKGN